MSLWVLFEFNSIDPTDQQDPNRSYLFGSHPHGLLCSGAFCAFATDALNFSQVFPGLKSRYNFITEPFVTSQQTIRDDTTDHLRRHNQPFVTSQPTIYDVTTDHMWRRNRPFLTSHEIIRDVTTDHSWRHSRPFVTSQENIRDVIISLFWSVITFLNLLFSLFGLLNLDACKVFQLIKNFEINFRTCGCTGERE